jgi:hypothetical protein
VVLLEILFYFGAIVCYLQLALLLTVPTNYVLEKQYFFPSPYDIYERKKNFVRGAWKGTVEEAELERIWFIQVTLMNFDRNTRDGINVTACCSACT